MSFILNILFFSLIIGDYVIIRFHKTDLLQQVKVGGGKILRIWYASTGWNIYLISRELNLIKTKTNKYYNNDDSQIFFLMVITRT